MTRRTKYYICPNTYDRTHYITRKRPYLFFFYKTDYLHFVRQLLSYDKRVLRPCTYSWDIWKQKTNFPTEGEAQVALTKVHNVEREQEVFLQVYKCREYKFDL